MEDADFDVIYQEYAEMIYKFLMRMCNDKNLAEDLMQDVFTSCYKALDRFDSSKCSEVAWLFIIAKNRLKNYFRDKKSNISLDAMPVEQRDPKDVIAQSMHLMHCREVTAEALKILDDRSRKIILLRFFEEKSHDQIAEIMNLSTGNVRVIQSRALNQMEEYLSKYHSDIRNI